MMDGWLDGRIIDGWTGRWMVGGDGETCRWMIGWWFPRLAGWSVRGHGADAQP